MHALLIVPNFPAFYPHIARHAQALSTRYDAVTVLAVFAPRDPLPTLANVQFVSCSPRIPSGVGEFLQLMFNVYHYVRSHSFDAIEAVDPPCLIPAALALLLKKTHLVYFSMEIFPDTPALAFKPIKRLFWATAERLAVLRAQQVLTVNQSVARVLENTLRVSHVGVVRSMPERHTRSEPTNGALRRLCNIDPEAQLLVYQGHLEAGRGLEFVAEALQKRPQVHLAVMGFGPMQSWMQDRATKQANIHYCGAHPFEQLMILARDANAGLVWIEPISQSYRLSLPGKVFEYVQAGLPVLGSPLAEIRLHVQQYGIGEVAESQSQDDFLLALDALFAKIAISAYASNIKTAQTILCWEHEQLQLLQAFAKR
jgi:hypothetical protein